MIDERLQHKKRAYIELRDNLIRWLTPDADKRAYYYPIAFARQLDDEPPKYDEIPGGGADFWEVHFVQSAWKQQVERLHKDEELLEELARHRIDNNQASSQQQRQQQHSSESEAGGGGSAASNASPLAQSQDGFAPVLPTSSSFPTSNISLSDPVPPTESSSSSESTNNSVDNESQIVKVTALDDLNWVSMTPSEMPEITS